jgi:NAD(P)-dependent dehydrogenase (short-subunit alcohol dehydrogenase family)
MNCCIAGNGGTVMAGRLENKIAIITGAGSGQGLASAKLFAAEGAKVIVAEWNEANGRDAEKDIVATGGEATFIQTDISKEESVKNMVEQTMNKYGRIDVLFNNAGIGYSSKDRYKMCKFLDTSLKEWQDVLDINLNGLYLVTRYVLPIMLKQEYGSIVNNSSLNAIQAMTGADAYTAAKGGIVALTRVWAKDYGAQGIRFNCICPGSIDTPMLTPAKALPGFNEKFVRYPIPRIGQPEEIAYAALFLASDESSYVTGHIMPVDGGLYVV